MVAIIVAIVVLDFAVPMKTEKSNDPSRAISSIVADEDLFGISFGGALAPSREAVRLLRPPEGPKREWEGMSAIVDRRPYRDRNVATEEEITMDEHFATSRG